jgi:hypothetical protein
MSYASITREWRRVTLIILETRIMMSLLIFCLILLLVLRLGSFIDLTITHMVLVHEGIAFVPRRFGYDPHSHCGDRPPCRHDFPAGGSYTRFEPRHLDGPCFLHHGSCPTHSNGDVQKIVKTSSGRMVKCWVPKFYLTNPSTEPSTSSRPVCVMDGGLENK